VPVVAYLDSGQRGPCGGRVRGRIRRWRGSGTPPPAPAVAPLVSAFPRREGRHVYALGFNRVPSRHRQLAPSESRTETTAEITRPLPIHAHGRGDRVRGQSCGVFDSEPANTSSSYPARCAKSSPPPVAPTAAAAVTRRSRATAVLNALAGRVGGRVMPAVAQLRSVPGCTPNSTVPARRGEPASCSLTRAATRGSSPGVDVGQNQHQIRAAASSPSAPHPW
jgi:hypothetical protein